MPKRASQVMPPEQYLFCCGSQASHGLAPSPEPGVKQANPAYCPVLLSKSAPPLPPAAAAPDPPTAAGAPVRALTEGDAVAPRPVFVVWELTLQCDQPCGHCGSRAGAKRPDELSTAELFEVVRSLGRMGA